MIICLLNLTFFLLLILPFFMQSVRIMRVGYQFIFLQFAVMEMTIFTVPRLFTFQKIS